MRGSALTRMALLGTRRETQLPDTPLAPLQPTWRAIQCDDPAEAFLQAAALEKTAFFLQTTATPVELPAQCPDESRDYVSSNAADAAFSLISGSFDSLLPEWVDAAAEKQLLATPRLIPVLLKLAEKSKGLRHAVTEVVGNRGLWLAQQTGQWSWLKDTSDPSDHVAVDDELWKTGTLAQRLSWLAFKHHTDPAAAAAAIDTSWKSETPEAREAFIDLICAQPHVAHELWLQKALNDRRQSVRVGAIRALMLLPASDFRERSMQRARSLLQLEKKMLGKRLKLIPPDRYRDEWKTDGIKEKPPAGVGNKAFWAAQILRTIPLKDWPALIDHNDPLALKLDPDWSGVILAAWQQAAAIHPDVSQLPPLLKLLAATTKDDNALLVAIAALIEPVDRTRVADLIEPLAISADIQIQLLLKLQPALDNTRHKALHRAISDSVLKHRSRLNRSEAMSLAICCDKATIPELLKTISQLKHLNSAKEEFARALELRHSYLKHFG